MKELRGNLFEPQTYKPYIGVPDAICITTNGALNKASESIMGKGCALEAKRAYPGVAKELGQKIKSFGNVTQIIRHSIRTNPSLVAFPVKRTGMHIKSRLDVVWHMAKRFKPGDFVPGWALKADPVLIRESAMRLAALANQHGWEKVVLVRPGCGAGTLRWDEVKPILEEYLDDRFFVITYN